VAPTSGPETSSSEVRFLYPDLSTELAGVALFQEVFWPRSGPELTRTREGFSIVVPRPPVDRMEYLFELRHQDGSRQLVCDPGNPKRAPSPFGDKSVLEFPEYHAPDWSRVAAYPRGESVDLEFACPGLNLSMPARIWSPAGVSSDRRLPLLLAFDGLEYDLYSQLTQFFDHEVNRGDLPLFRAALLHPVRRDQDYSASPGFTRVLSEEVIPQIEQLIPVRPGPAGRVAMGASLGAVAALHLQWERPGAVGGLLLQSGSFFNHHYFSQQLPFDPVERICMFTERIHQAAAAAAPVPAALTCGVVEGTLLASTAMASSLGRLRYSAELHRLRDAHNWVAWRDAFDPHLKDLLIRVFG
jgi:enterochelin esterase family protein